MKARELVVHGFYWCSHDLSWSTVGKEEHRKWNVIEFDDLGIASAGGDYYLDAGEIPDNVEFVGPLTPP